MSKLYKTIFSRYAEKDLLEIIEYYHTINRSFARSLLLNVEKRIGKLKRNPQQGRIVPELEKQNIINYRELIEGNYRIIYSIQDQIVTVHSIIDAGRNVEEILLKKLLHLYS